MEVDQAIFFLLAIPVFTIFLIVCVDFLLSLGDSTGV